MLDLAVVDAVAGAVVPVRTAAVVSAVQVETHGVVGAGAAARPTLVDVWRRRR